MDQVSQVIEEKDSLFTNIFSYYDPNPIKLANFITHNQVDLVVFAKYQNPTGTRVQVNPKTSTKESQVFTLCTCCPFRSLVVPYVNVLHVVSLPKTLCLYLGPRSEIAGSVYDIHPLLNTDEHMLIVLQLLRVSDISITMNVYNKIKQQVKRFESNKLFKVIFDSTLSAEYKKANNQMMTIPANYDLCRYS